MKLTQLRAFEKHLEGAAPDHLSPIYFILGKESFQRKHAVDKLINVLQKSQKGGQEALDYQLLQGSRLSTQQLKQELDTLSLFCPKKALVIDGVEDLDKESLTLLEKYFSNPSPNLFLVLSATSLHHGSNFYKKGEKVGIVLEFQEEKPWEKERSMQEWVAMAVRAEGKSIDAECCRQLVHLIGAHQEMLTPELQKLFCYVGERKNITSHDISTMISPMGSETCWQLGEAIFRRDGATALRVCKELLAGDTVFIVLLRQLRSQFQIELQVCSILEQEKSVDAVTRQFPYMRGTILDRHVEYSTSYGLQGLISGLLKIDEAEFQAKNSGLEAAFLAELLIVKLTSRV